MRIVHSSGRPTRLLALLGLVGLALVARDVQAVEQALAPKVVVITGRAGAGKGTVAGALAAKYGVKKYASGDGFRMEAKARLAAQGIHREPLPAEVSLAAADARAKGDKEVGRSLARSIIKEGHGQLIVVEGFRSPEAVAGFREHFPQAKVVAIQVSAKRRHEAVLKIRSKGAANGTGEGARPGEDARALRARDRGDSKLGVGRLIAQKDVTRIRPRAVNPDAYKSMDEVRAAIGVVTAESVVKIERVLGL